MTTTMQTRPGSSLGGRLHNLPWWAFLVSAAGWLVLALVVLQFNLTTVTTIAVLAGLVIILAGAAELVNAFVVSAYKWLHATLGVLFVIIGIVALAHPGNTFSWLAAFIGWYLLFKGIMDIILAFSEREVTEVRRLGLIVGIVEVVLGFWASGHFERRAYLLIVLVAIVALTRGITDVVLALQLRRITRP
jgi:uncharacterized membrane protein HdeD (DUF308 family)